MEFPLYNSRISVYSLIDYIHSPSLPFLLILSHQVDGHFNQCHCNVSQFTSFEYKRYQASKTAPELVGRSSEDRRRRVQRRYVLLARASLAGDVVAGKFILQKYYVLLYTTQYYTYLLSCMYCVYGKGERPSSDLFWGNSFFTPVYSKKMETSHSTFFQ